MKTSVILEKLRSFMRLSQTPVSAHMLVEQISQSLRLQPVVIGHAGGAGCCDSNSLLPVGRF